MIIDEKKLQKEIVIAKKSIAKIFKEKDKEKFAKRIPGIEKFNQIIVLGVAEFRCQRCGVSNNLQIHHLIMKQSRKYMDYWRYASQRYYWANQICLCKKCHLKFHKEFGFDMEDNGSCISPEKIEEIKDFLL